MAQQRSRNAHRLRMPDRPSRLVRFLHPAWCPLVTMISIVIMFIIIIIIIIIIVIIIIIISSSSSGSIIIVIIIIIIVSCLFWSRSVGHGISRPTFQPAGRRAAPPQLGTVVIAVTVLSVAFTLVVLQGVLMSPHAGRYLAGWLLAGRAFGVLWVDMLWSSDLAVARE